MKDNAFAALLRGEQMPMPRHEFAVVLDFDLRSKFLPIFGNGTYAMGTDRNQPFCARLSQSREIRFRQLPEDEIVS